MPIRRRRDDRQPPPPPRPSRLPGAGSVSPELPEAAQRGAPIPEPDPDPPLPELAEPAEPSPVAVLGRFVAAAHALTFAEQAMQAEQRDEMDCYRAGDGSWWVAARLPLGAAREMAGLGGGRLYIRTASGFAGDRGWGDPSAAGPATDMPELTPVTLLDLVRVAGVHPVPAAVLNEVCVLVPGHLVRGVLERAQDLRLQASYQLIRLDPLFTAAPAAPSWSSYAVWLSTAPTPVPPADPMTGQAGSGPSGPAQRALPTALLSALADDPFALVCRPVERTLLISYGSASPLSDAALARLVAAAGDETWLLAPPPEGCARVSWTGQPLDASGLVELSPAHQLIDLDGSQSQIEPAAGSPGPAPRALSLVPTHAHTAQVDAVLLDDTDLDCLALLLAGDPLADAAMLIRGAGRHLLTAPGGLLTELAVGEPLTCIGPGSIYLPLGFRLDPPVGPAARAALFRPDRQVAQVMLRDARLGYDLETAEPLWHLWAGPAPDLDRQLPRTAVAVLAQAAAEVGDRPKAPDRQRSLIGRPTPRPLSEPEPNPDAWRQQAYQAELAQDYTTAAQLYARHNEPLRAARLWEREAKEKY
jgi:hypothetical protein